MLPLKPFQAPGRNVKSTKRYKVRELSIETDCIQMRVTLSQSLAECFRGRVLPLLTYDVRLGLEIHNRNSTGGYTVSLNTEAAEAVVDACLSLLAKEGLNDNSEPNSVGLALEELVDRFNPQD